MVFEPHAETFLHYLLVYVPVYDPCLFFAFGLWVLEPLPVLDWPPVYRTPLWFSKCFEASTLCCRAFGSLPVKVCLCGPTVGSPVCCDLFCPHQMQQELLMTSTEQCITRETPWRCGFVMGRSRTTLSLELMKTTAAGVDYRRKAKWALLKNKACKEAAPAHLGPEGLTNPALWWNDFSLGWLGTVMLLHYNWRQFYSP